MGKLLAVTEKMQNKQGGLGGGEGKGGKSNRETNIKNKKRQTKGLIYRENFERNLYIFCLQLHLVEFYLSFVLGFVIFSYIQFFSWFSVLFSVCHFSLHPVRHAFLGTLSIYVFSCPIFLFQHSQTLHILFVFCSRRRNRFFLNGLVQTPCSFS